MKIWTNTIKPLICKQYIEEYKYLNMKYNTLIKGYSDLNTDYGILRKNKLSIQDENFKLDKLVIDLIGQVDDLIIELEEYQKDDKHSTLEIFMDWLKENVKPVSKSHRLNADLPNRTLRNTNYRPSNFLRISVTEEDKPKILEFAEDVLFYKSFTNEDDLVYKFNIRFDNKFPTRTYYSYDQDLFGFSEYWATPMQTINMIKTKKTYGDCEDVMILKYWCLRLLLDKYFPNWDKNRLRGFLSWVMGAYYHAVLCWVKEGVNDWIPIETTYFNQRFKDVWLNNKRLRNNEIAYKINFSFDTESEYEKI